MAIYQFEYHTFLHHSQTYLCGDGGGRSLSTIHFYIILKPISIYSHRGGGLSTIHFYIILKLEKHRVLQSRSLSTIHFYIILKPQI